MRVWIDPDACVGSGQCVRAAHDVFDQRAEDGVAVLVQPEPPTSLHDAVRAAAALCPSAAIRLDE